MIQKALARLFDLQKVSQTKKQNHPSHSILPFLIPPPGVSEPDFYIFGFHNPTKDCIEFVIVPSNELKTRLQYRDRNSLSIKEIELLFWLMPDSGLYETKFIGSEGEWFYISSNGYGRMADDTNMNYTKFLNGWKILT